MPRGAKISLALNELKQVALHSNSNITSKHATQVQRYYWFCMQKKTMGNCKGLTHDKSRIMSKGKSNIL